MNLTKLALLSTLSFALMGCDDKPEHYYVWCDNEDTNGWNLIDTESKDGFLIACSYQSPDRKQSYTVRCNSNGCE
jgi:hypothetical protein